MTAYAFIFVLIIASSLIINKGFGLFKRSNKVKNTGTEKIRSMTMGRTELKGKSLPIGESREIPFTEGRCVRLEWNIKEYRESSTDEDSKEWKTIASGEYKNPFILDDGSGKTYIDTEDQNPVWKYSEKSTQKWNSRILYRPFYNYLRWFEKYPSEEIKEFEKKKNLGTSSIFKPRKYTQKYIEVEEDTYVLGETKHIDGDNKKQNDFEYRISNLEDSNEFIISGKSEEKLEAELKLKSLLYVLIGSLLLVVSLYYALIGVF